MEVEAMEVEQELDQLMQGADFCYSQTYNSIGPDAWLPWSQGGHVAIRPMHIIGKNGQNWLVLFYLANYHLDQEEGVFKSEKKHAIFPISEKEKNVLMNSNMSYDRIHELLLPYLNQIYLN